MYPSNGNGDEELNHIQKQINEKTNQSLDSTRRMLDLVAESQDVGINTMVALDEQGEKLRKIEVNISRVNRLIRFHFLMNRTDSMAFMLELRMLKKI